MEQFDKEMTLESLFDHLAEVIAELENKDDQESIRRLVEVLSNQTARLINDTYER